MGTGNTGDGVILSTRTITVALADNGATLLIFAQVNPRERDWRKAMKLLEQYGVPDIGEPVWFADIDLWEIPLPRCDTPAGLVCKSMLAGYSYKYGRERGQVAQPAVKLAAMRQSL
jgi:hypothetical protein